MARKSVKLLEDELQDLVDAAQAIQNIADRDSGGVFSEEQQASWDALMGDEGDIAKKRAELDGALKLEAEQKALAAHRRNLRESAYPAPSSNAKSLPKVISKLGPLRAFKGEDSDTDAYNCGMWLRALVARKRNDVDDRAEQRLSHLGWSIRGAATEGTDTAGGYTVPDPLASAIINYRALSGVSRSICRVTAMTSDTLSMPKKTGTLTVYYPGEASAITESDQTFGQVALTAKKRATLSKISQELSDDAVINIVDDLAAEIGSDLAIQEDNELVNGDGTATYGGEEGLLNQLGAGGVVDQASGNTWAALTTTDLTATMAKLPSKHYPWSPIWLCSPAFFHAVFLRLLAAGGGNAITSLQQGASRQGVGVGPMGNILGYDVYGTDQMPTATATSTVSCLFGAFSRAVVIGDRMGVSIAMSGDYAFNEDVVTVRGTARYDINVHEPGDGSNAGAYVGLKTGS